VAAVLGRHAVADAPVLQCLARSDQLGEHAAGAERNQRPEDRILDRAGKQLGTLGDIRLDDHGPTDLRCRP